MPCNRRYQQHHVFGCHPSVWAQAAADGESLFAAFLEDAATFKEQKTRTSSDDKAHVVRMDVPGVKSDRISIEEKNGEIEITAFRMRGEEVAKVYQEVFYLNPFRFDIDQGKATLTNGVLTLTIPKNQAGSLKTIDVESASVPSDLPTSNIFQHTLDLPGVSASSLEVKLIEECVHLTGKRSLGDKRVLVQRSFEVPPSMDTLQARALLQDGVFTFLAPIHNTEEGHLRTIFVQEAMEVESAAMAEMKISEEATSGSKTKGDEPMEEDKGDVNVETVNEDAEAKDTDSWEEVRPSSGEKKE